VLVEAAIQIRWLELLALALALAMPAEVPDRESIITVAFAVVVFSIVVQGMTVRPLIRWAGKPASD